MNYYSTEMNLLNMCMLYVFEYVKYKIQIKWKADDII